MTVHVEGMHCMHCAAKVEKAMMELGAKSAKVDLDKKVCLVEGLSDEAAIRNAVAQKGFQVVKIEA